MQPSIKIRRWGAPSLWLAALTLWVFGHSGLAAPTDAPRRLQFREPHSTPYTLVDQPAGQKPHTLQAAGEPRRHHWRLARRDDGAYVEIGSRLVVQLEAGTEIDAFLEKYRLVVARTVNAHLFILQADDYEAAIAAAEGIAAEKGVQACYPVMRRHFRKHNAYAEASDDSYYAEQWQLENRGSNGQRTGPDLNTRAAWPISRGAGVTIAVADTGVQLNHPDLLNRVAPGPHYNFFLDIADGGPGASYADHGTAVAGLIAAEGNNRRGVVGVAPEARFVSWVIFGTSYSGWDMIASEEQLMDMFQYGVDRVAVQNHSWGSATTMVSPLDLLCDNAIQTAVTQGRGGKGVVMVRAAGNMREDFVNANDDAYASDPRVITVAAVRKDGRVCAYSNPGACLLVAAPSGDMIDTDGDGYIDTTDPAAPEVLTTDRTGNDGYSSGSDDRADYAGFNGTSASSPEIAGLVGLLLSANSNLTYRDVQHLLVHSTRHFDWTDPDLSTNGAGFRFSHNVGFGVPDAGFAMQMAKSWNLRPAVTRVTLEKTNRVAIPDDALRVVCAGAGISNSLTSILSLPSFGLHPDAPTAALPLVYVGQAISDLTEDLRGKGALIQRGTSSFNEKIERAARAGAAFAIIFNNTGTTALQRMGATGFAPIPAVSISRHSGEALRNFIASQPATTAKLQLTPAVISFNVTNTLLCEHVGVRLKTTHKRRCDVRVALVSPMGSRSVLQAINDDTDAGPVDWTYWTVQHFNETTAGEWRLEVSDERNTSFIGPYGLTPATGVVTYAQIILNGPAIADSDRDGLDDHWEQQKLGNLNSGPKEDPDGDGFNNAREQILGTHPATNNAPFKIDLAILKPGYWRVSWPALDSSNHTILSQDSLRQAWQTVTNVTPSLPTGELVVPASNGHRFYRVKR